MSDKKYPKENSKKEQAQHELDVFKEDRVDLQGLIKFAHEKGGFSIVPTEKGMREGKAMEALQGQTQMQLDTIFEQMKVLAKQAEQLRSRVDLSSQVYDAKYSFDPVVGDQYYLYDKKDGPKILSMISPDQWNNDSLTYIATVKFLADETWEVISKEGDEN